MVGVLGLEPRTSSLSGTRSNQLSYTPIRCFRCPGAFYIMYKSVINNCLKKWWS